MVYFFSKGLRGALQKAEGVKIQAKQKKQLYLAWSGEIPNSLQHFLNGLFSCPSKIEKGSLWFEVCRTFVFAKKVHAFLGDKQSAAQCIATLLPFKESLEDLAKEFNAVTDALAHGKQPVLSAPLQSCLGVSEQVARIARATKTYSAESVKSWLSFAEKIPEKTFSVPLLRDYFAQPQVLTLQRIGKTLTYAHAFQYHTRTALAPFAQNTHATVRDLARDAQVYSDHGLVIHASVMHHALAAIERYCKDTSIQSMQSAASALSMLAVFNDPHFPEQILLESELLARGIQTWDARLQEVLRTWRALVERLEENRKKLQADAAKSDKTILGPSSPLAGVRALLDEAEREKSLPLEKDPWPLQQRLTDTERAVLIKQRPAQLLVHEAERLMQAARLRMQKVSDKKITIADIIADVVAHPEKYEALLFDASVINSGYKAQGAKAEEELLVEDVPDEDENEVIWTEGMSEAEIREFFRRRVEQIRAELPNNMKKSGNVGIAEIEIEGVPAELQAYSSINYSTDRRANGFVLLREQRVFETKKVNAYNVVNGADAYDRMWDTEAKILEEIAAHLDKGKRIVGKIALFTERKPCASCSYVISQFKKRYPDMEVNVYDLGY